MYALFSLCSGRCLVCAEHESGGGAVKEDGTEERGGQEAILRIGLFQQIIAQNNDRQVVQPGL